MNTFHVYKSDKPTKKFYVITPQKKKIYFGAAGYDDFLHHKDVIRKHNYELRHRKNENWKDPNTAGFWSKHLLWGEPTLLSSIKNTEKEFKIKIILHR